MIEYKNVSMADKVYEILERQILNETYKRGQYISEKMLCDDLGVSRTPVREAINRLRDEDLVEETPQGTVVVGMSLSDMQDVYEVKRQVESIAMRRAAELIDDETLAHLEDILERQEFYVKKDDIAKVRDLDTEFHDTIYMASGSRVLNRILSPLHHKVMRYRYESMEKHGGRSDISVKEHRAIYEALAAHDPDRVEDALNTHIRNAYNSMISANVK